VTEPHELIERIDIVPPVLTKRTPRRKLVTAKFDRDLEAIGRQVVVVLHAAAHRIPTGAVGDTIVESVADHVARLALRVRHVGVVVGESVRDVLEELVVWRGGIAGLVVL